MYSTHHTRFALHAAGRHAPMSPAAYRSARDLRKGVSPYLRGEGWGAALGMVRGRLQPCAVCGSFGATLVREFEHERLG